MANRTAADRSGNKNNFLSSVACVRFVRDMRMFVELKQFWAEFARYEKHVRTKERPFIHAAFWPTWTSLDLWLSGPVVSRGGFKQRLKLFS